MEEQKGWCGLLSTPSIGPSLKMNSIRPTRQRGCRRASSIIFGYRKFDRGGKPSPFLLTHGVSLRMLPNDAPDLMSDARNKKGL